MNSVTDKAELMDSNRVELNYLALGDSYTVGTAIKSQEAFPYQLIDSLEKKSGDSIEVELKLIARNAWRTDDLQRAIKREILVEQSFDLVTLLIGVNNQYQGLPIDLFEKDFNALLDTCEKYALEPSRIAVLSIPNYGYTPFGEGNKEKITQELADYNALIESTCSRRYIQHYMITDISLEAENKPDFVAKDNLHPSALQYAAWVTRILPGILNQLDI